MRGNQVKKLYAIGHARWYDAFKRAWNVIVASRAEKELARFLRENVDGTKTILELGCGTALNLEKIASLGLAFKQYVGLDFSADMLRIAQHKFDHVPNVKFEQRDVTTLDDIHEKFDIILCIWLLSHLERPAQLVNHAQRWLYPHGKIFLIFFSKPRWFVRLWFDPLAHSLFSAHALSEKEVEKFKNVKTRQNFSAHTVTVIEIEKII